MKSLARRFSHAAAILAVACAVTSAQAAELTTQDYPGGSVLPMIVDVGTQPLSIAMTGQYTDTLVKTPNGWHFKSRQVQGDAH